MIFHIDASFTAIVTREQLSDICCAMIQGRQYVDCNSDIQKEITRAIDEHGSSSQKELFRKFRGFDITSELRHFLTVYSLDQDTSLAELNIILQKPSRVLVENGPFEWEVYKRIIGTYKSDRQFKNLFLLLEQAKHRGMLEHLHGGGYTTYPSLLQNLDNGEYKHVSRYKICILFDRDTDGAHLFDIQKNTLFQFLCGKKSTEMTEDDIYVLSQSTYIWHMWYKRTIENYFPDKQYSALGIDVSHFPVSNEARDYFKIDRDSANGYDKNKLSKLAEKMSRNDYEGNLKRFVVDGQQVSEIQLLLLKMIKII